MSVLSIKEILTGPVNSYKGSEATKSLVEKEIQKRWGKAELKNYNPKYTARTFHSWLSLGFKIKRGEKAIKSITFIEQKDKDGNTISKVKRPCFLFYYLQVEKVNSKETV